MSTFRKSGVDDLKEKGWPPKCKRNHFFCTGLMPNRYKSVTKLTIGGALSHHRRGRLVLEFSDPNLCCLITAGEIVHRLFIIYKGVCPGD